MGFCGIGCACTLLLLASTSVHCLAKLVKSEGSIISVVVLFSAPISVSICNRRNSKATGLSTINREASDNLIEASEIRGQHNQRGGVIFRANFSEHLQPPQFQSHWIIHNQSRGF